MLRLLRLNPSKAIANEERGKKWKKKRKLKTGKENQVSWKKLERTTELRLGKNKNKRSSEVTG